MLPEFRQRPPGRDRYSTMVRRWVSRRWVCSASACFGGAICGRGPTSTVTLSTLPVKRDSASEPMASTTGGGQVDPHVRGLVGGEDHRLGALDVALGHLLAIDEQAAVAALGQAAAVVVELETDGRFAGLELVFGLHGEPLQTEEVVVIGRHPVLHVQGPAAEAAALDDNGPIAAVRRNLQIGGDGAGAGLQTLVRDHADRMACRQGKGVTFSARRSGARPTGRASM